MNEEYEEMVRQKTKKEEEKTVYQEEIIGIEGKLQRLDVVKKVIEDRQEEYRSCALSFMEYPERYLAAEWQGCVYNQATGKIWGTIQEKLFDTVKKMDTDLDAVCNKMNELKNKQENTLLLISAINKKINELENDIEKYSD